MYERPDVNDEDLGIRAFQIKRGKAVERSIQLIRHGLGASWRSLTAEEIEELEWILGELWAYLAHTVWDELHFGLLTMSDIVNVLTFGSQLRRHLRSRVFRLSEGMCLRMLNIAVQTSGTTVLLINQTRTEHIMTIEDPIEYLFDSKKSVIDQREVRTGWHPHDAVTAAVHRLEFKALFLKRVNLFRDDLERQHPVVSDHQRFSPPLGDLGDRGSAADGLRGFGLRTSGAGSRSRTCRTRTTRCGGARMEVVGIVGCG